MKYCLAPSTSCDLCMHLQFLKLLRPKVKEQIHLQSTVFDLDLRVKVTQDVAQYALHHVTYAPLKVMSNTLGVAFT